MHILLLSPTCRRVAAPKAGTLRALEDLALMTPSACHVLFSSVAALLGSPGQSNYSAANAALDAAAGAMVAAGVPAVSMQFGPWKYGGMAEKV